MDMDLGDFELDLSKDEVAPFDYEDCKESDVEEAVLVNVEPNQIPVHAQPANIAGEVHRVDVKESIIK